MTRFLTSRSGYTFTVMQAYPIVFLVLLLIAGSQNENTRWVVGMSIIVGIEVFLMAVTAVLYQLEKRGRI